jgi:hypothetical protein
MVRVGRAAGRSLRTRAREPQRAEEVLVDAFDEWRNEVESVHEVGSDRDMAYLATIRDWKIVRWEMYGDRKRALQAAGLEG